MASKFNFVEVVQKMKIVERNFLSGGIELAKKEMIENISTQSSKESGKAYPELSYLVDWRPKNPPRLFLTGELILEIAKNKPRIIGKTATLTIDPIDERGKGYASYHQDGINQYKSKENFQAEFVTQSEDLINKQVNLLISELDRVFK